MSVVIRGPVGSFPINGGGNTHVVYVDKPGGDNILGI